MLVLYGHEGFTASSKYFESKLGQTQDLEF